MKEYKTPAQTYEIVKRKTNVPKAQIKSSKDASDYIRKYLYNSDLEVYESFYLLLLNSRNIITGFVKISQGGIRTTIIDIQLISKYVVNELAPQIIVAHNHPSGNANPSESDKESTKRIKQAMDIFNVNLLDHLIITADDYFSFADNGILN